MKVAVSPRPEAQSQLEKDPGEILMYSPCVGT